MEFCPECLSVMSKSTTAMGKIVYTCHCQLSKEGNPEDTLMAEGYLESTKSDLKHIVFIENAPFDPAGNIVLKDCHNCGLNFMTMIRIGSKETTMYTCSCGYSVTHEEYMKSKEEKKTTLGEKSKSSQTK